MTKPGNSGSEEPTQAEAPEVTPAGTDSAGGTGTPAAAEPDSASSAEPEPATSEHTPTPHESPIGAAGGPPDSTLPEGTDSSGAEDAERDDAEATAEATTKATTEAAEPADEKPANAKPAVAKKRARAEVEKTPPPYDDALRAQAKRRFEEPPPRTLRFSLYFFVGAGAIWLLSMVASLIYKNDIINNEVKRNTNPKITPDQIASAVNQILWVVTIAALAFTVFLALFGYKATEGTRRARTLVTIFAVMLVLFHLLLNGTQLGILSAMFALVGLALLWSPSARKYFPPRNVP